MAKEEWRRFEEHILAVILQYDETARLTSCSGRFGDADVRSSDFLIEAKWRNIKGSVQVLYSHWKKVCKESRKLQKLPLLAVANPFFCCIVVEQQLYEELMIDANNKYTIWSTEVIAAASLPIILFNENKPVLIKAWNLVALPISEFMEAWFDYKSNDYNITKPC